MTPTQLPITGGCLCGVVRYTVSAEPLGSRTCWCRLCQYLASGSATVNAIFPADAVTITGPLKTFAGIADSGCHMMRGFCPECGTQVSSIAAERPHLMVLRTGTLDNPNRVRPTDIIWTSAAPDWAALDPDLPHHPEQIPPVK
ncbi:MAG TPA: GFA family protein [Sphingomonas sp.]|nr:GFA family protein [Sphingomonas sp.]